MKNLCQIVNKTGLIYRLTILLTLLIGNFTMFELYAQNVLSGPYLIEPGETEMTIRWEMDGKGDFIMEYGRDISKVKNIDLKLRESKHDGHLYEVVLTKLKPNTSYHYRIITKDKNEWTQFKTYRPNQRKFTFVAMGDSRSNPHIFTKILEGTSESDPDFIISMGDMVEIGGAYDQWHKFFFPIAKDVISTIPFVSTLGDHEAQGDNGELFRYFLRKDENVEEQWFSYDFGSAHFISLDYRHANNPDMVDWFINDISSSENEWTFVYMHRAAYNFGGHRTDWGRGIWPELFSEHKVDIVFAGHSHLYERFYPVREKGTNHAVTYVTTGGAGAGLYQSVKNQAVVAITESVNHFVTIDIDKNKLKLTTTRMDGSLLDKLEIEKNKTGYNKDYEDKVISQDLLNTITGFNSAISHGIFEVPLLQVAADYELTLQSYSEEPISFSFQLSEESAKTYNVESIVDTLQRLEKKEIVVKITRDGDMTIHPWGNFDPELRFKFIYEYKNRTDTIIGKAINYWPRNHD